MPNYATSKIYTIRNKEDPTLIYVGSTIERLGVRMCKHRAHSKQEKNKNRKLYKAVDGNWDDWYIELHSDFPCERLEQLRQREGQVQREIGTLNVKIENRTIEEWREENKDKICEKKKEYRQLNKEEICEKNKEYFQLNKDKILEKQKKYKQANADNYNKYQKEYQKEYQRAYRAKKKAEKEASKVEISQS